MATTINPSDQTITQYNVQIGAANNVTANVAPGTTGIPLVSQGASSNPSFSTAVVGGGGTGQTTLTNHGVLVGAGTSAITQLAAGTAGQVLQSGGASADPVYSTATYPGTAGTSGNLLQSDGTNWISATPSTGLIKTVNLPLTNANIKALNTTALTLVSAPGNGIVIIPISLVLKLNYAGTNAFTGSGNTGVCYGTVVNTNVISQPSIANNAFWVNTANQISFTNASQTVGAGIAASVSENAAMSLTSSGAIAGNAAGDNTGSVQFTYYTVTI